MVPLATPARRATSSSRAAAKPEAENSSSAAARMASRRAVLTSLRRRAGARRRGTGAVRPDERAIAPAPALTDQSVIMPRIAFRKGPVPGGLSPSCGDPLELQALIAQAVFTKL